MSKRSTRKNPEPQDPVAVARELAAGILENISTSPFAFVSGHMHAPEVDWDGFANVVRAHHGYSDSKDMAAADRLNDEQAIHLEAGFLVGVQLGMALVTRRE